MFDLTINLGSILTIAAFLIGGVAFAYSVKSDTKILEYRFTTIDGQLDNFAVDIRKINDVMVTLATQSGRLDRIEDRQLAEGKRIDRVEEKLDS